MGTEPGNGNAGLSLVLRFTFADVRLANLHTLPRRRRQNSPGSGGDHTAPGPTRIRPKRGTAPFEGPQPLLMDHSGQGKTAFKRVTNVKDRRPTGATVEGLGDQSVVTASQARGTEDQIT